VNHSRVVQDAADLVRIDSRNPGPGEAEVAHWVRRRLTDEGFAVELREVAPGRPNLLVTVPGAGTASRLVLMAHMDTVPHGDGWSDDPLSGRVEDGRLHGRGSADMKGGLAVAMHGIRQAARRTPFGDVVLALTVDEETAGMRGVSALIDQGFFRRDDQVLALEPTDLRLRAAQVGVQWLSVRVTGRMAHAGRAHLGVNANHVMARIVVEMERAMASVQAEDPVLGRPRMTVGTLEGGIATNVVAPTCMATVDLRLVPGFGPDEARALAETAVTRALAGHPEASAVVTPVGATRPPASTGMDTPIVIGLDAAMRAALGRSLQTGGEDGREAYTDASLVAARLGMRSCAVFGPGHPRAAHAVDESVTLRDLEDAADVVGHLVAGW